MVIVWQHTTKSLFARMPPPTPMKDKLWFASTSTDRTIICRNLCKSLDMYFRFDPAVERVADGKWLWAPMVPKHIRNRKGVFMNAATGRLTATGMVVPGFKLKSKALAHTAERKRWIALDGTEGDEQHLLTTEFHIVTTNPKPDCVIIGHWNNFQE